MEGVLRFLKAKGNHDFHMMLLKIPVHEIYGDYEYLVLEVQMEWE
jgi:hypothetical protein